MNNIYNLPKWWLDAIKKEKRAKETEKKEASLIDFKRTYSGGVCNDV